MQGLPSIFVRKEGGVLYSVLLNWNYGFGATDDFICAPKGDVYVLCWTFLLLCFASCVNYYILDSGCEAVFVQLPDRVSCFLKFSSHFVSFFYCV